MKKSILFLLTLILTSCNKEESYSNICYQCFYGNELELSLIADYELSEDKIKMQNDITSISDQEFYFDYYVLDTISEVEVFTRSESIQFTDEDKEKLALKEGQSEIVFIAQIPEKYKAFKRNNFQYRKSESEEIFLTSNFYTYSKREDIAYCFVDVVPDEKIDSKYLYSFVIKIDKSFYEFKKDTLIRGILSDSAYKKEDLPNL